MTPVLVKSPWVAPQAHCETTHLAKRLQHGTRPYKKAKRAVAVEIRAVVPSWSSRLCSSFKRTRPSHAEATTAAQAKGGAAMVVEQKAQVCHRQASALSTLAYAKANHRNASLRPSRSSCRITLHLSELSRIILYCACSGRMRCECDSRNECL